MAFGQNRPADAGTPAKKKIVDIALRRARDGPWGAGDRTVSGCTCWPPNSGELSYGRKTSAIWADLFVRAVFSVLAERFPIRQKDDRETFDRPACRHEWCRTPAH